MYQKSQGQPFLAPALSALIGKEMEVSHVCNCTSQSCRQSSLQVVPSATLCLDLEPCNPLLQADSSRVSIDISSSREPPRVFQPRLDLDTVDSDNGLPSCHSHNMQYGRGGVDSMRLKNGRPESRVRISSQLFQRAGPEGHLLKPSESKILHL